MARPPSRRRRERRQQRSKEKKKRQQDELLELAFLICVLEEEETATKSRGTRKGSKNIRRVRKTVDAMLHQLGRYARKAYGMSVEAFKELASTLKEGIEEEFNPCSKRKHAPNGLISPELRLSAAIRYFKGGAVVDIMLSHGIGRSTVYASADGIIDVVNKCTSLDFNEGGASFPSHEEQKEIAKGFQRMSGAGFSKVVAAVDGMLIWTVKPRKKDCRRMQCGEVMFHCFRKDKYGINLLAMVDHKLRFRWICMNSPGRTSDYLSWINSGLPEELEKRGIILKGYTIIGDNAFVETEYMATPIPGTYLDDVEDGYNFYLSQLRITVERAFGVLVHRWGILRRPLSCSIDKVGPLVMCLTRLHNYCIDSNCGDSTSPQRKDERSIRLKASNLDQDAVELDQFDRPAALLGSGHHFSDIPGSRRPAHDDSGITPMREMMKLVDDQGLRRPMVRKRKLGGK